MIPNIIMPPDMNVIVIYGNPIDNNIEPSIAPIKLATLNMEQQAYLLVMVLHVHLK